jgi:Amt family ammonium transporter
MREKSMIWHRFVAVAVCALGMALGGNEIASAQDDEFELGVYEEEEDSSLQTTPIDRGDHAWMLVSCALVLMMTGPGLALFYSGLVRKKNVLGVMMQCIFLMGLMTIVWGLWGYSLAFGGSPPEPDETHAARMQLAGDTDDTPLEPAPEVSSFNPWIGNLDYLFMKNVAPRLKNGEPDHPMEGSIPRLTHMLFQGMFFIITPALICGAFAERMKFSAMVVFSVLWGTLVYCPLCHWVWDGGILAYGSDYAIAGALDFAGGTVVHISSGVSALVCAIVLGKRLGYGSEPMPPHNLTYTAIGAAMLWVGWFGFNAGSALAADGVAASAFAATHFAAAAGAVGWAAMEWISRGKATVLGACSGAVAGLVCITPASGYVQPMPALIMGVLAGIACYLACAKLKNRLGYDDSLDAFGVHGVGGTLGALLTGVFATQAVYGGERLGLVDQNGQLMINQALAVVITWVFAAVVTLILLKILDAVIGLRVTQEDELQGLDLSQHGEEGYIFL